MEEGGGNKRRVLGGASEEREDQGSPISDGAQTKKACNGTTPSWIPHATANKSTHQQVDGLVEKAEREMKVRTISDSQRNFAAQFSSSAAERGADKPASGSRWAPTPESTSDKNQSPDRAGEEAILAQGAEQSSVGREKDDRPTCSGEPQDDRGGVSGEGSPNVQRAPVPGNGDRGGEETKDKPKVLGQAAGGLVKGSWTKEEDQKIIECIAKKMTRWSEIAERVEGRVGKQCRERWFNHLDPTLRKCSWTPQEDEILVKGQAHFGNSWTKIGKLLPGRSENAVKNRWNSAARKKGVRNQQRNMAGLATMSPVVSGRGAMHSESMGFHQVGMPPERRLGGQVRYVPVPSWQAIPPIHHIHAQIAPSAVSILASPPMGMDGNQMLQTYPGSISHAPLNSWHGFPIQQHQAPALDPSRIHGSTDVRELLHVGCFGQMAPSHCQHMYGQPFGLQPAFPMTGPVVPGPMPEPVLPRVGDHSQQPTPQSVSSSPPRPTAVAEPENGTTREGPNGVAAEEDTNKDAHGDDELSLSNIMLKIENGATREGPNGVAAEEDTNKDAHGDDELSLSNIMLKLENGTTREGPNGVAAEEDANKDAHGDDELSLSNIMLKMSLEEQTNMVGSYSGCKSSHRMAGLMGRENVFDACNSDPALRGFPEDDFGSMCASFDGILDITTLGSFGQEQNMSAQENDRPARASDLLKSPSQTERRRA